MTCLNLRHAKLRSILVLVALLQGCTFSVPQFDAAVNFARSISAGESGLEGDAPAVWLASVGERGSLLTPYRASGLIVFANVDGDAIAFDGWTIRSITGFGLSSTVSVTGKDGARIFIFNGVQTTTDCNTWTRSGLDWDQACANGDGQITLDEIGNIQSITMALGNKFGIVTLRVAK